MAKYLQLHIPAPCHEQWDQMTPKNDGRFCQSCQKTVIDFTTMTDQELTRWFQLHKGSSCGRLTTEQLDRAIPMPRKPLPWLKYFVTCTLPAFLLSLNGNAQAPVVPVKTETAPVKPRAVTGDTIKMPNTADISGVIQDNAGNPIAGASVMVKGTRVGVAADTSGRFSLTRIDSSASIIISAVGFESREVLGRSLNSIQP